MKLYINNLVQRLQKFSQSLDKKEIFIDIPWVTIDEDINQQKFIFKRNGDLIMSLNGIVTIGKWEYLSTAKSLLIDRIEDKILLNQNFIDSAVMVLRKDGEKEKNFILANEILIPNLDVADYLKKLFYQKSNIIAKRLKTGEYIEIENFDGFDYTKAKATIEGEQIQDGEYELEKTGKKFIINGGKIVKVLVKDIVNTNKGQIVVERQERYSIWKGDLAYQNNLPAPDGKYRIDIFSSITIKNGKIIKI